MLKKTKGYFPWAAVLCALAFNNWILALFLNHQLLLANGSVSEFSAVDQPYSWVFRSLDILSGISFLLLTLWWQLKTRGRDKPSLLLFIGGLILGVSNLADALAPLHCSETLSSVCSEPISLSLNHFLLPDHAYTSIGVGIGYFLMPLGGWLYARHRRLNKLSIASRLVLALTIALFLTLIYEYATVGITVRASGITQEIQMLGVGAWLACWGFFGIRRHHPEPEE